MTNRPKVQPPPASEPGSGIAISSHSTLSRWIRQQAQRFVAFVCAHKMGAVIGALILAPIFTTVIADIFNEYRKAPPPEPEFTISNLWAYQSTMSIDDTFGDEPEIIWEPVFGIFNPTKSPVALKAITLTLEGSGEDAGRSLRLRPVATNKFFERVRMYESEFLLQEALLRQEDSLRFHTPYPIVVPSLAHRIVVPRYSFEIVDGSGKRIPLPKTDADWGRLVHRLIVGDKAIEADGKFNCRSVQVAVVGDLVGGDRFGVAMDVFASVPGCKFTVPIHHAPPASASTIEIRQDKR